jgi:hypothetical protein
MVELLRCLGRWMLNGHSPLGASSQPIKNDDARLEFYEMYEKEATQYDMEFFKYCNELFSSTMTFVRPLHSLSLLI